ncbi:MAG: ATP-dependent RNA helicase DeaD [Candidatus Methanoperedenaceae archaeon GB50]|nr:MAG: ATP-dependent RNA helicase DeaD [Candidatus Methanoperedenaceae archaeon GB50]
MNKLTPTVSLKTSLKNTWSVFFGGFRRLTPIQEATIPHILKGENVIVCSPTATGKTEAVIAPLIERLIPQKTNALILLYIAPTRALLNNLLVRLDLGFKKCGFKAIVRTGDKPYLPKNPFQVLFTTPESLDSLLCRQKKIWRHIQAIVIDEIHFLDNTYRGDQLRILLRRLLKEHLKTTPQFAALSATLYNPEEVGKRYFSPVQVIQTGQPRLLKFYLFKDWDKIINLLKKKSGTRPLYFVIAVEM